MWLLLCDAAFAENWPGWRGPSRTGVTAESGVPLEWSADKGLLWKTPLTGAGTSTPIVWGERVFVTSSDGPKQDELHLACFSRDDGREQWRLRLWGTSAPPFFYGSSGMATPTPATDGQFVYAFYGTGDVFCVDFDGGLVWQRSLADEYGPFENRFAAASSPLLYRDTLLLQCDHYGASYAIALDKATGANRWKTDRPEAWLSWSSPQLLSSENGSDELVLVGSEKIDALDPVSGERLWTFRGMAHECIPTPLVGHGLLYAVSGPNGASYCIRPGGRGDVTDSHLVWSSDIGTPFVPSGILVGDNYYLVNDAGIGTCLNAHTGEQVWRKRLGGHYTASPVSADDRVYFTNEEGQTLVIRAGVSDFEELAHNTLDEPVYASPAISQGHIFVRTAKNLCCIGQ